MYLLVFAFLIIGMLGVYTQVLAVETARMFAGETAVAESMITWHVAAMSLAGNIINPNTAGAGGLPIGQPGCSFTAGFGTACLKGAGVVGPAAVTITGGGYTSPLGSVFPQLAPSYNTGVYQWKSMAFQMPATGGMYVVTFVEPATISATNPPPGYVKTATGTQINITASDLFTQLRHTSLPLQSYGAVSTVAGVRVLSLPPIISGGTSVPVTYTLPTTIPDGSLAIISPSGLCSSC